MYGMSPKVAAPIATARTKCRRSNLPSRRPRQHAQEAHVEPFAMSSLSLSWRGLAHIEFSRKGVRSRSYYTCAVDKSAQPLPATWAEASAARSSLPRTAPSRGGGGESRQAGQTTKCRMIRPVPSRRRKSLPLGVPVVGAGKSILSSVREEPSPSAGAKLVSGTVFLHATYAFKIKGCKKLACPIMVGEDVIPGARCP